MALGGHWPLKIPMAKALWLLGIWKLGVGQRYLADESPWLWGGGVWVVQILNKKQRDRGYSIIMLKKLPCHII